MARWGLGFPDWSLVSTLRTPRFCAYPVPLSGVRKADRLHGVGRTGMHVCTTCHSRVDVVGSCGMESSLARAWASWADTFRNESARTKERTVVRQMSKTKVQKLGSRRGSFVPASCRNRDGSGSGGSRRGIARVADGIDVSPTVDEISLRLPTSL